MAYKKIDMIKQCLKVLEGDQTIYRIEYLVSVMPFSSSTFYNHKLEKLECIKNALNSNRVKEKKRIINKLRDSNNILGLLAYLRMLADPDEYDRLNTQKIDHTSKGDKIQPLSINVVKNENAEKYEKHLEKLAKLN